MKHASFSVSLMWLLHDVFHSLMFLKSCAISFIRAFEVALVKPHRDTPQCPLWSQRETAAVRIILRLLLYQLCLMFFLNEPRIQEFVLCLFFFPPNVIEV